MVNQKEIENKIRVKKIGKNEKTLENFVKTQNCWIRTKFFLLYRENPKKIPNHFGNRKNLSVIKTNKNTPRYHFSAEYEKYNIFLKNIEPLRSLKTPVFEKNMKFNQKISGWI